MPRTPDNLAKKNEEITETSLQMMEELLHTNKEILGVLQDIAAMVQDYLEGGEEDNEEEDD
jgi:hypothetical protein